MNNELFLDQSFQSFLGGSSRDFSRIRPLDVYLSSVERVMRDEGLFRVNLPDLYHGMDTRQSGVLDMHIATAIAGINPAIRSIGSVDWGVVKKKGKPTFVFETKGTLVNGERGVAALLYAPYEDGDHPVFHIDITQGDPESIRQNYRPNPFNFRDIATYGRIVQDRFEAVALLATIACYTDGDTELTMFPGAESAAGIFIRIREGKREIIFQHPAIRNSDLQQPMITLARVVFRPAVDDVELSPFDIVPETILLGEVPSGAHRYPTLI